MTLYSRLEKLVSENGLTFAALEKKLKFSNGSLKKWETSMPSADKILQLSEFFNVSCDYLLTGEDRSSNLTDDEQELISFYRKLDLFNKGKVIGMLTALVQSPSVFSAEEKVI